MASDSESNMDFVQVNDQCNSNKSSSSHSNSKKRSKVSHNSIASTQANQVLSDKTNTIPTVFTSNVWQYAIRGENKSNYAVCCLCPDNKRISTNIGSTSTLRMHLILQHGKHDLVLQNKKRRTTGTTIDSLKKRGLHQLCVSSTIRDGRTFNDFEKHGIKKLLQEVMPGKST